MGIYTNKILRENVSPEDVINTPGDIGAELDAIEKAVCGPDGIESHRSDIEAAQAGVVGEPLEEAFTMIYEAEYNYNQIMRCIGMNELKSYTEGKEYVFTEADKTGFFETFKNWLKKAFEKVAEFFQKVIASLTETMNIDKKFVEKHNAEIRAGYEKLKANNDATIDTYEFANMGGDSLDKITKSAYFSQDDSTDHYRRMESELNSGNNYGADHNPEMREKDSLDRMGIYDILPEDTNMSNLTERLTNYLRGEKKTVHIANNPSLAATAVIGRLCAQLIGSVKAHFELIKGRYAVRIKMVDDMRRLCNNEEDEAVATKKIAICEAYMVDMKHDLRVENIKCAVYMSALKARAARDRALAHKYYMAGKSKENNADGTAAKNESVNNPVSSVIFSSMNFV